MRNLNLLIVALAFAGAAGTASATTATATSIMTPSVLAANKGAALAPHARVSLATARTTALKAHPGKIIDQELEKESGGSGLRYSFDIASAGKTYEVGVDAKTGAVLENKAEGKNPD